MQVIYLPQNLDFEIVQRIAERLRIHPDCILMFINEIINARFRAKRKIRYKSDSWLPICQRYLFQRVHHNYTTVRKIKEYLMDNGVIECDQIYCPGEKCYGFRFSQKYRGQRIIA